MKMKTSLGSLLSFAVFLTTANAATIIFSDNFSGGTNGVTLNGKAPSTDNTGLSRTYVAQDRGFNGAGSFTFGQYDTSTGNPASSARTGYGSGTGISLASGGSVHQADAVGYQC